MENNSRQIKERNTLSLINTYRSAIMGFAALWILFHHEWLLLTSEESVLHDFEYLMTASGFTGVDIFLLISGMGLYYAIQKHDIKSFYKRRFIRILPPFIITAIVIALVDDWTLIKFIKNVTGYALYFEAIHSFLWYATAIMTLYLFFPLYYKLFERAKNKVKFTAFAILVWFIVSVMLVDVLRTDLFTFTHRIPVFLIGVLFGWLEEHKEIMFNKLHWINCIMTLLIGFGLIYIKVHIISINYGIFIVLQSYFSIPAMLIAISGTLLLAKVFQLIDTYLKQIGKWIIKSFSLVGTVSFELYVVQQWVGDKVQSMMIDKYSNLITNIVDISAVAIACVALHLVCKPIIRALNKIKRTPT